MRSNGGPNGGEVFVLYQVVNSGTDNGHYNAFRMPRSGGVSLASVKHHCHALRALSHAGSDGYHWRVRVDEKQSDAKKGKDPVFTWWDVQDENAKLPVKEASMSELNAMFSPQKNTSIASDSSSSSAKNAIRSLGKAMHAVTGDINAPPDDHGPRVSVVAFKLLDLVKMHDDFTKKYGGVSAGHTEPSQPAKAHPARALAPNRAHAAPQRPPAPAHTPAPRVSAPPKQQQQPATVRPAPKARVAASVPQPAAPTGNLMDFGDAPTPASHPTLHHSISSPAVFKINETRAQKAKREYAKKKQDQNLVWDEIDQRYVAVDKKASVKRGTGSAPPGPVANSAPEKKIVGIKLDASNAVGKSAAVQAAVHGRVNEMKESQQKAVQEIRERENKKKMDELEEDEVRKCIEPKVKAWSEEHGKKKQLRALLCSLHTILWPEAGWKPISLGDILDGNKAKRCYHKASRVVHPDKTHNLSPEKRFLAKRIFDSLSQAKTAFDEGE